MTADFIPTAPYVCAKQADTGLDRLLSDVLTARGAMVEALRARPTQARHQAGVRRALLRSLEFYAAGLSSRGLAPPPRLRDELALQRHLAANG